MLKLWRYWIYNLSRCKFRYGTDHPIRCELPRNHHLSADGHLHRAYIGCLNAYEWTAH